MSAAIRHLIATAYAWYRHKRLPQSVPSCASISPAMASGPWIAVMLHRLSMNEPSSVIWWNRCWYSGIAYNP
jgi:hypothetical protein